MRPVVLSLLLAALACAPRAENPPPPTPAFVDTIPTFDAPPGDIARAHAHNDYYNFEPLLTALKSRFYSVEVDVFLRDDRIVVAHYAFEDYGDLAPMYLDRVAAVVRARGSVYGDGHPFTLWIDLKDDSDELTDRVHAELSRYPDVFTSWRGDDVQIAAPVTVVLTGAAAKARYAERSIRYAARDSNSYSTSDPPADARWSFYALHWANALAQQGGDDDASAARGLVESAHALGRKVRFYAAPDDEESWRLQLAAGADFIGTDEVEALAAALAD